MPKLYVECKNREGLLSETFFNWISSGSPKVIDNWIEDTEKKAGDQYWFLILKGRSTDPWIFTKNLGISHYPKDTITKEIFGMEVGQYYMCPLKELLHPERFLWRKEEALGLIK